MLLEKFGELAQISGLTAVISISIGIFFGFIVLLKAIRNKQRLLFLFFLCIIFTLSPWYASGFGYLYWLLTGNILSYQLYVTLGLVGVPIAILAWLDVYMTNINPEKKKLVLMIYGIFSLVFEIYVFYFVYLAPGAPIESLIGVFENPDNPTDIDYKGFAIIFLVISIATSVITGLHFSITSMKIKENPELVWKGRLLFIGFLLFGFAAVFDSYVNMAAPVLVFVRLCLMATTLFFYTGFILPKWTKKLLGIED